MNLASPQRIPSKFHFNITLPSTARPQVFSSIQVRTYVPIHHLTKFIGYGPLIRIPIPAQYEIFLLSKSSDRLWGPFGFLANGTGGVFPLGVERLRRETDHSPPTSSEIKKQWSYTSTPTVSLYGVDRDTCSFIALI